MDLPKQIADVLGQEDGQKLMQSARQAMRPAGGAASPFAARRGVAATAPAAAK